MKVIALDPGNTKSAFCVVSAETLKPLDFGIKENEVLRQYIRHEIRFEERDVAAIEMLQSYGNLIGRDVLETAVWVGRFYETLARLTVNPPIYIFRMEEKMNICKDSRAGDTNIRRALIDRFCTHDFRTGRGTIKNPDWFYGFKADVWAAYAVALTCIETKIEND